MEDDVEEDTVDKVLSDLENLDTPELRLMCSRRNLSSDGDKSDFLIRLKSFFGLESKDVENESKSTLEKGKYNFWKFKPKSLKSSIICGPCGKFL